MRDLQRCVRRRFTVLHPRGLAAVVFAATVAFSNASVFGQESQGALSTIRDDVRSAGGPAHDVPRNPSDDSRQGTFNDPRSTDGQTPGDSSSGFDNSTNDVLACGAAILVAAASPFFVPHFLVEQDNATDGTFLAYPYENNAPGWMRKDFEPLDGKPWAVEFGVDSLATFEHAQGVTGHLLIDTQSRFGLDTSTTWLEERLPRRRYDHLVLGDCNLSFRFAQSPQIQFRAGLGLNWLTDATRTDLGFDFTYGVEVFPCKPWVMTATLDWGTLGRAELFRFRTTVGASIYGVEAYTGFEYLDIDRTQLPGLLAGVQIRR
jgi:hypothetical protein